MNATAFQALLAAPVTAFFTAFAALKWLLKSRLSGSILDHPNLRSLHAAPIPRTGGIAVLAAALVTAGAFVPPARPWLLTAGLLAVVSFIDDWRGLPHWCGFPPTSLGRASSRCSPFRTFPSFESDSSRWARSG